MLLEFIFLHGMDGRGIYVNPYHIVSVAESKEGNLLNRDVHCVVSMVDRKFLAVVESCDAIRQRLREIKK